MISLLFLIFFFLMILGTGHQICKAIGVPFESTLDDVVFSAAAGMGLLSYLVLGIGLAGGLYPYVIYALFGGLLCLALFPAIKLLRSLSQQFSAYKSQLSQHPQNAIILLILLTFVLLHMFRAMAPVTEWDAVYYHLAAPKIYIQHHRIIPLQFMINVNYVVGMEMIHTFFLLLQDDSLTQLVSVLNSVVTLLSIYAFCKKYLSGKIGLFACLIFYTVPWFIYYVPFPKPDITLTLMATLTVYAFIKWLLHRQTPWLSLSALMAGFAGAWKLPGALIGLILIGWLFCALIMGKLFRLWNLRTADVLPTGTGWRHFLLFSLLFIALLAPWYLKCYLWTGNPIWPYMYGVFGGTNWSPEAAAGLYQEAGGDYNQFELWTFLRVPWMLTFTFKNGVFSPIFLAFLPALILLRQIPAAIKMCLCYIGVYMVGWFLIAQHLRFLFPILPLLSIVTAYVMSRLMTQKMYRVLIKSGVAIFVMFALLYALSLSTYVAGSVFETRYEYLSKRAWLYQEAQYINQHVSSDSKIGIFFGAGYYVKRDYIYLWPYYQAIVNVATMTNPQDLLKRFKELSITHLVWQNPESRRYHYLESAPLFIKWKQFFTSLKDTGHLEEIFRGQDGIIYEINFE